MSLYPGQSQTGGIAASFYARLFKLQVGTDVQLWRLSGIGGVSFMTTPARLGWEWYVPIATIAH
jgi:hypothetical protein